jgi:tRNA modification GTPase
LYHGVYHDGTDAIDDVLVMQAATRDAADGSVDISCHGGLRVVERILLSLKAEGAVLVDERAERASDESLRDWIERRARELLVEATTRRGVSFLLAQANLLPTELERIIRSAESGDVSSAQGELRALVAGSRGAHYLYRPADIAFVGPVNAGKSLLTGRLAGREGALVTARAGTTRDWVSLGAALDGVPVNLIDTAGVRATDDTLESRAIRGGRERARAGDLFVLVLDNAREQEIGLLEEVFAWLPAGDALIALNKCDLGRMWKPTDLGPLGDIPVVAVSALTGEGLDGLRAAILSRLGVSSLSEEEPVVFDRAFLERLEKLAHAGGWSGKALADGVRKAVTGR